MARLLSVFDLLNINVGGVGLPLQCLGIGTYQQQLATTMLAPLVVAGVVVLVFILRSCYGYGPKGKRAGMLRALPWLLMLSFMVFPVVSSAAFRAFSCERFDTGREFLRADLSVECSTTTHVSEEHEAAKSLAMAAIMIFPVGISLMYALLMLVACRAIQEDRPTELSRALGFLVRDFEPGYLWWEVKAAYRTVGSLYALSGITCISPCLCGGSFSRRGRS